MQKYKALIFDADHTLLDYGADERAALKRVLLACGYEPTEENVLFCHALSETVWTEVGLYDVLSPRIQREYHRLYRSHVARLFERAFERLGVSRLSPVEAGELFLRELEAASSYYAGAIGLLTALRKNYSLYLATNGLSAIQRGRISQTAHLYDGVFVSEELGAIKPSRAFFSAILQKTGLCAADCLMIGDSLLSDMRGAYAAGIDRCWLNPAHKENRENIPVTYEISSLSELSCLV